jgi:ribonuclease BN (tRNA processing enzyme)
MQLTVLGAGTCVPVAGFSAPGYLLEFSGVSLLLDAGPGTLGRLPAHDFNYQDLRNILITHLHPDHSLDLLTMIQALGATPGWTRTDELNLIGCSGLRDFIQRQLEIFPDIGPETFSLNTIELEVGTTQFPGWSLKSALTGHTPSSLAFRIDADQKSIVYTGDVANPESLIDLCQNADLLICECSFPDSDHSDDHLNTYQVGTLAHASQVKSVLLTHLYPPAIHSDIVKQVQRHFSGTVEKARDGMIVSL